MDFVVTDRLTELARDADRIGLANGVDYYIRGVPFTGPLGSDVVGLSFDGHCYSVEYRSADRTRDLLRTPDFELAARRFLDEATATADSFVPRRAARPAPVPTPAAEPNAVVTALLALGIGLLVGLLVVPVAVTLTVVATASGSYGGGGSSKSRTSWWRGKRDELRYLVPFWVGVVAGVAVLAVVGVVALLGQR